MDETFDASAEYEKAYREIELFDGMVMDTLRTQRMTSVPFHVSEDKSNSIEQRMAVCLVSLNAQIAELLESGVNPSPIIRGFMQSIQDAYINPANNREMMGTPASKRAAAIESVSKLITEAVHNKSLEKDLRAIV